MNVDDVASHEPENNDSCIELDAKELDAREPDDDNTNSPSVPNGTCISCLTRPCDIVLQPCFDIVVCSECWEERKQKHERACEVMYKNNNKKISAEKKKVLCPCCGECVKKTNKFNMATVQGSNYKIVFFRIC